MTRPRRRASSDAGMTLVDTVVAISLVGVLSAVLATTIQVVAHTTPRVERDLTDAHDVEQLVRYLPADVAMTPAETSSFSTDQAATSSCLGAAPGTNVLRMSGLGDQPGELAEISYRLSTAPDGSTRLVRYSCQLDAGLAPGTGSPLELAAGLPAAAVQATLTSAAGKVTLVELAMTSSIGKERVVSGVPQGSHVGLAAATTTALPAVCPANPMQAVLGYEAFVSGDMHLAGIDSYGPVATGGKVSFANGYLVTPRSATNGFIAPGESVVTGILAEGGIDWSASSGWFSLNSSMIHLGDTSATWKGLLNINQTTLYWSLLFGLPPTFTNNSYNQPMTGTNAVHRSGLVDFAGRFATLRQASADVAALPGSCAGAASLVTKGVNGFGAWSGSGPVWLEYQANAVNVFTATAAQLAGMTNVNRTAASAPASTTTLLVINVTDAGAVRFVPPIWTQNEPRSVLWNFPNATSVIFDGPVWGSVLAPKAAVTANGDMRGNVIAASFTSTAGSLDWDRRFYGVFPWDPWVPT